MPTSFPGALDALNNPTGGQTLADGNHAGLHANANDAIEALQAKVGVNGSTDPASVDKRVADLELQPVYNPAHDHVGGDGALIPAAGLDTDNSAADGDLMSFSGSTGKMTWLKSVTYQPTAGAVNAGAVVAGTYASAQVRDGSSWQIQEASSTTPGYDVQLTFSSVKNFNEIRAYMRYQGGGSHLCEVGLKNGDAGTFTTLTSFNSQNGLTDVIVQVDNGPSYIASDGSVTVRFYHPLSGNGAHNLYLDMVNLLLAVTGIVEATGTSTAGATVTGNSANRFAGVGSSAGVAAVTGNSANRFAGVGSSAGIAAVTGNAVTVLPGVGASAGVAASTGNAANRFAAVGTADGLATVTGDSDVVGGGTTIVEADGVCTAGATVSGVGAAVPVAVGSSAGVAVATGLSANRFAGVGNSVAAAAVAGQAASIIPGVGVAAGLAVVTGDYYYGTLKLKHAGTWQYPGFMAKKAGAFGVPVVKVKAGATFRQPRTSA